MSQGHFRKSENEALQLHILLSQPRNFPDPRSEKTSLREIIAIESNDSACSADKLLEVLKKSRLIAGCGHKQLLCLGKFSLCNNLARIMQVWHTTPSNAPILQ